MQPYKALVCRADYLLPLSEPDRGLRIADGYVLAIGDVISEVGQYTDEVGKRLISTYGSALKVLGRRLGEGTEGIPKLRGVILPGFVKAHGHDHEQPIIGVAKDEPLTSWLDHAVNPFAGFMRKKFDSLVEELGSSPHLATYRMARVCDIHYGITASMVHHCNHNKYHLEEIAKANEAAGTTMIVAVGGQDRYYQEDILDEPQDALARLKMAVAMDDLSATSFCPGPDQDFSNSRSMLIPLKAWSREHDTLFHIHSSEEPKTTKWFSQEIEPGMTPVEYFDSIGILDSQTVLAHQVNNGPADLDILARTGAKVVHNPLANTILGSGMPPIIEMMGLGIDVAISTDGSGSADNQNIIGAARLAAQYQKAIKQDATLLPAQRLLEMITSVPARILRLNQGELGSGRQADWVLMDLTKPNLIPTRLDNLMENIIWAADGSEIDTVVARGRVVKERGVVQRFRDGSEPADIMAAVQRLSERFVEYMETAEEIKGTGAHQ